MAKLDKSVSITTGRSASKSANMGAVVNLCFSSQKAASALGFHFHSFLLFLVNSVNGLATRE